MPAGNKTRSPLEEIGKQLKPRRHGSLVNDPHPTRDRIPMRRAADAGVNPRCRALSRTPVPRPFPRSAGTSFAPDAIRACERRLAGGLSHLRRCRRIRTGFEIVNGLFPAAPDGPQRLDFSSLGDGNSCLRDFTNRGSD